MTIVTVFGTRPEIIKLSTVIEELDRRAPTHILIHTNQHYDYGMDEVFMQDLEIRQADYRLTTHGDGEIAQLGEMLAQLEGVFRNVEPSVVVVLGDTNSTLAGALAAKKSGSKLAHIESGCRSFDRSMPEEQNRLLVDHLSDVLFAPTRTAVENLGREGIRGRAVHLVGSTLVEVCGRSLGIAKRRSTIQLARPYALMTLHRRGNIESKPRLRSIIRAMARLSRDITVFFPLHPHTKASLETHGLEPELKGIAVLPPLGYLDFLKALSEAEFVLTDSGGVQQEAQVLNVPILTARQETEWVETVKSGACVLVDANGSKIVRTAKRLLADDQFRRKLRSTKNPYTEKKVSKKIAAALLRLRD